MKMKKLSVMLACVMLAAFLGGCGASFDAAGYISAILDNSYKNDSTKFVSMKIGTAEEAAETYETAFSGEVDTLIEMSGAGPVSDEQRAQVEEIMKDIYGKTKYTVDGAEKQDDGSYVVTISYEQINVFEPAIQAYMDAVESLEAELLNATEMPSEDELRERLFTAYVDSFNSALANVTYDAPTTANIKVEIKDQLWQPNSADVVAFETDLFDIAALNALLQQ
ncbi:MAG: hypothetical protein NC231_13280 [Bacillus sp. (in: Bacteria)]|nr:hypothetical protein [Bacillus sp. (in: firmicutes)]MCM1425768.1 hypothetical protein [Eubacterium sp.]